MSSEAANQTDCQLPAAAVALVTKRWTENFEESPRELLSEPGTSCQVESKADMYGQNELHRAAKGGHVERVKELLDQGFDPRARDKEGSTALHVALWAEQVNTAMLLADAGLSSNIRDAAGWTPLHIAAVKGYAGVLRNLVAAGGDTRLLIIGGRTPLHFALHWRNEEAAEFLADVDGTNDVRDSSRRTPLSIAAAADYIGVVKKLLFGGVYPHAKDEGGQHILQNSLSRGRGDIAKVILVMCAWEDVPINFNRMWLQTVDVKLCKKVLAECRAEIQRMRSTKLEGTNLSYYELARLHGSKMTRKLAIEAIRLVLNSDYVTKNFPHYFELMAYKVRRAEMWRSLANQCQECFYFLSPPLPATVTDIVLLYLNEQDMRNFITACKF